MKPSQCKIPRIGLRLFSRGLLILAPVFSVQLRRLLVNHKFLGIHVRIPQQTGNSPEHVTDGEAFRPISAQHLHTDFALSVRGLSRDVGVEYPGFHGNDGRVVRVVSGEVDPHSELETAVGAFVRSCDVQFLVENGRFRNVADFQDAQVLQMLQFVPDANFSRFSRHFEC